MHRPRDARLDDNIDSRLPLFRDDLDPRNRAAFNALTVFPDVEGARGIALQAGDLAQHLSIEGS